MFISAALVDEFRSLNCYGCQLVLEASESHSLRYTSQPFVALVLSLMEVFINTTHVDMSMSSFRNLVFAPLQMSVGCGGA